MKFLLRDDDTSALTDPRELEACYAAHWERVPVSLSITPFRIPGEYLGVPPALYGSTLPLPLHVNESLVASLRRWIAEGKVHVAMHGYHHSRERGQPEFVGGDDLEIKVRRGRRYLEDLLGVRVTTFVPPNNSLGPAGFAAVVRNGLNIVHVPQSNTLRFRIESPGGLLDAGLSLVYRSLDRFGRPGRCRISTYRLHKEAPYHTVGPDQSLSDLRQALQVCHRCDGVFILATHYHAFSRRMCSGEDIATGVFRLVSDAMDLRNVQFCGYDGIW